jgi:hypothetical protein
MTTTRYRILAALLPFALLGGCESFGRGVTEAVLKGSDGETEDTRNCEVEGRPFTGKWVSPSSPQLRLILWTDGGRGASGGGR